MSSFVDNVDSKVSSDESKSSENLGRVKSLAELAASNLATVAADQIKESESLHDGTEIREAVKSIESSLTEVKNVLALVIVLDNTASQGPSWSLIQKTIHDLIPFLDSRHGESEQFQITYEIRMIYANDYTDKHTRAAASAKRMNQSYLANPREGINGDNPVIGELCRITSQADEAEKKDFLKLISEMTCYGGADGAEAYAPAIALASEHVHELTEKYGSTAVIATIFCGDDIPHGCSSQIHSYRDNWEDGDPSGVDWFDAINNFPCPIHCLSPSHADEDSRCALGYATKKTGGFHLIVNENSSVVLLRLLMAEMKLSWLVERNIKDMESATPEEISAKIAELVNKESFVRPTNTVPVDPRISKIDEEIKESGIRPNLMRIASEKVPRSYLGPRLKTPSTIDKGVNDGSVFRALRTATGGMMPPTLMRAVSDKFVENTRMEDISAEETIPIPEVDEDEILSLAPPRLNLRTGFVSSED